MRIIETRKGGKLVVRRDPYVRVQSALDENSRYRDRMFNPDNIISVRTAERRKKMNESIFAEFEKSLGLK